MALELLTQREAAAVLGVDRTTLLRWQTERQVLPELKMAGRHVYDRRDVEAYLEYLETHGRPKPGRKKTETTDAVAA